MFVSFFADFYMGLDEQGDSRHRISVCSFLQPIVYTCSQILHLPELEYCKVEDWDKYEHAKGGQVVKSSDWVPERGLEVQTRWTRVCVEICCVISEDKKM